MHICNKIGFAIFDANYRILIGQIVINAQEKNVFAYICTIIICIKRQK